ncbi:MAG: hypothetical protein FJ265_13900 [Planctomycetes bacterium]|nr:hypothetical protein [Planctomycetota bacterium]
MRFPSILPSLLFGILAAPLAAQTPPCFALNDLSPTVPASITAYGFSGQNTFGWQITPTTPLLVQAVQFYTRNNQLSGDRFFIAEIWDENPSTTLPGNKLAGGAWRIVNSRPFAWQGANLDRPVVLQANTSVWVVWVDPGASTAPEEPGGTLGPRATRSASTGAWTASAALAAVKVRLFCSLLDDAHSVPVGTGCPQSTGQFATMYTNEQPTIGNAGFFFETSGTPPGGALFVLIGVDPNWTPIPALGLGPTCFQNTDIVANLFAIAGTGNTRGPTCAGYLSLRLPIPNDPTLANVTIAMQPAPFDALAGSLYPFAAGNAQRITVY